MSGSQGTEDSILSNIPDFQGESDDTSTETSAPATQQTDGDTSGRTTSAPPTTEGGTSSGTQQPPQQREFRRRHDGLLERPNADNPRVRDLVDPITGKVVAQGGIERRVYEEGQHHARENTQLKTQLQQLQGFVGQVGEVTREAARLNIKPEDQLIAMRVMSDFLKDPVRTLQYMVEEVKAKGYPIPFMEQGISPGMDMNAIARMIDQKMAPLTQQQQQAAQAAQSRQRAEAELNTFIGSNPEAQENLDVLAEMLQAQPGLTMHDAYTKMIRWAHEHSLDWTQPLKPQIAAQSQPQVAQGQQPTSTTQQQQPSRPLPGARSVGRSAQPVNGRARSGNTFDENASWADIIRDSMEEHNVRLN